MVRIRPGAGGGGGDDGDGGDDPPEHIPGTGGGSGAEGTTDESGEGTSDMPPSGDDGPSAGDDDAPSHIPGTGGGSGAEGTTDRGGEGTSDVPPSNDRPGGGDYIPGHSGDGAEGSGGGDYSDDPGVTVEDDSTQRPGGGSDSVDDRPGDSVGDSGNRHIPGYGGGSGAEGSTRVQRPNEGGIRTVDTQHSGTVYEPRGQGVEIDDDANADETALTRSQFDRLAAGMYGGEDQVPDDLDARDVRYADGSYRPSRSYRHDRAAESFDEQTEGDVQRSDVEMSDDGPQIRDQYYERQFERSLEEEYGVDLQPGEDFTVEETDEGVTPQLTDEGQRAIAAHQATTASTENPFGSGGQSPQTGRTEFDAEDFRVTDDGPVLTAEAQREYYAQEISESGIDVRPEDVRVTDDGPTLTDDAQERMAEQRLEQQIEEQYGIDVEAGQDFEAQQTAEGYEPEFTDEGLQQVAAAQTEAEFGREAIQAAATAATAGQVNPGLIEGVSRTIDDETARNFAGIELDPESDIEVEDGSPQLSDAGAESLAEQRFEGSMESEYGGDFERGRDYTIEETDEGYQPQLTDEGQQVVTEIETARSIEGMPIVSEGEFEPTPEEVRNDESPFGQQGERFGGRGWLERNVIDPGTATINEEVVDPLAEFGSDVIDAGSRGMVAADPMAPQFTDQSTEDLAEENVQATQDVMTPPGQDQAAQTGIGKITKSGISGGGRVITGIPSVSIEAGEYAVAGGSSVVTGDFDDFVDESVEAGTEGVVQFGEQAIDQPYRTVGMVLGSFGASGAAIRGARVAGGPTASRATSFAIQPGEELAISAARSGVVPNRAATAVPGVREGHVGSSNAEASGSTSETGGVGASLRDRVPNVEVDVGRSASNQRLEINVNRDIQGRIMGAERAVSNAPGRIRDSLTPSEGSFLADDSTARMRAEDLSQPAADVARRARSTAQQVRSSAGEVPQRVRTGARNLGISAQVRYFNMRDRMRSPEEFAMELDRGRRDYDGGLTDRLRGTIGREGDSSFLADDSTRSGVTTADVFDPAIDAGQSARDAARRAANVPSQAIDTARTGARNAAISGQVRYFNMRDRMRSPEEFAMELDRGRRDYDGGIAERLRGTIEREGDSSFLADDSTRSGVTTADVVDPFANAGARVVDAAGAARDTSVRVDVGRPGRTRRASEMTIDEDVGAQWEGDFDDDQPLPYEPGENLESGPEVQTDQLFEEFRSPGMETDTVTDRGVAVQQSYQQPVTEIDARRSESTLESSRSDPSFDATEEPLETDAFEQGFDAQEPTVDAVGATEFGSDSALDADSRVDVGVGTRGEQRQDPFTEPTIEPRQETGIEAMEESRTEAIMEPSEPNPEPRFEAFGDGGDRDDDPFNSAWEEDEEVFGTGFASAEELQEQFEDNFGWQS